MGTRPQDTPLASDECLFYAMVSESEPPPGQPPPSSVGVRPASPRSPVADRSTTPLAAPKPPVPAGTPPTIGGGGGGVDDCDSAGRSSPTAGRGALLRSDSMSRIASAVCVPRRPARACAWTGSLDGVRGDQGARLRIAVASSGGNFLGCELAWPAGR